MRRSVFTEDHEAFRKVVRAFMESEVVPAYDGWHAAGIVPREFYYKLGELGLFGIEVAEQFGRDLAAAERPGESADGRH